MNIEEIQKQLAKIEHNQQLLNHNIKYLKQKLEGVAQNPENQSLNKKNHQKSEESILIESTKQSEVTNPVLSSSAKASNEKQPPKVSSFKGLEKNNWEFFVGQSLISKIGILITIIGVFIGVKYSLENDLISPAMRISLGYLIGIGLFLLSKRLQVKQEDFSAVLLSGSLSIMYFITFAAYSFYDLFHIAFAFLLMVLLTVYTVFSSIKYNKEFISLIGMVGAYGIPFLLSSGQGNFFVLFFYMLIINAGILAVSTQKSWKILLISTLSFTWLVYASWLFSDYDAANDKGVAFTFAVLFFALNYLAIFLSKVLKNNRFNEVDLLLSIANAFIFYAIGFYIVKDVGVNQNYLGLFTLFNALLHFFVTSIIYLKELVDQKLKMLSLGMTLIFVTLFVPIQLDGNYVTLIWALMGVVIFWIGSSKNIPFYLKTASVLFILALFSQLHDWSFQLEKIQTINRSNQLITPFLNIYFLSNLLSASAFGAVYFFLKKFKVKLKDSFAFSEATYFIPIVFILSVYIGFYLEISTMFNLAQLEDVFNSAVGYSYNVDLISFKKVTLLIYSFVFCAALTYLNTQKIKNQNFARFNTVIFGFFVLSFLTVGLLNLSELREHFLLAGSSSFSSFSILAVRYLLVASVAIAFLAIKDCFREEGYFFKLKIHFECATHFVAIWVLSSEFINVLSFAGHEQTYKLGLSILWGLYALFLVFRGMVEDKKHLRVSAIVLFSVTLLKLFFFDISHLNTISKMLVLIILGGLLLLISYLYNKNNKLNA